MLEATPARSSDSAQPIALRRSCLRALGAIGLLTLSRTAESVSPGQAAPSCVATTADHSQTVSVAALRGKVVYLDFWASWCPPCRESFPFMNDLHREFNDRGLSIVAVSVDKNPDDARQFLERFPPLFTVLLDATWKCASEYELPGMPTSFVIDRAGTVRAVHIGFRSDGKARIRTELIGFVDEGR